MIFLRTKDVVPGMLLIGAALMPVQAWTMDELSDGQLEQTTGQVGLTLLVQPQLVATIPTIKMTNVIVGDSDGIAASYTLNGTVFTSANPGTAAVARMSATGVALQGATLGSAPSGGAPIRLAIDATGGGASGATAGLNPAVYASLTMPNVQNISVLFGSVAGGVANVLDMSTGINDARTTSLGTYVPVMSLCTYSTATGCTGGAGQQMNIALSPLTVDFGLGKMDSLVPTYRTALITLTNLNISKIDFGAGNALNLESPNGAGVGASRLSFAPTLTGLNLSGTTIDVDTQANLQTALTSFAGSIGTGGLLIQQGGGALSSVGITLNNIIAGTPGVASATAVSPGSVFASGMLNAPIGSVGAVGMQVTGLKIGVSGM